MATYHLRNNGDPALPINNRTQMWEIFPLSHETVVFVTFRNSAGEIITPTAGTLTFRGGPTSDQMLAASSGGLVEAKNCGAQGSYTTPRFDTTIRYMQVKFTGLAGPDMASCHIELNVSHKLRQEAP